MSTVRSPSTITILCEMRSARCSCTKATVRPACWERGEALGPRASELGLGVSERGFRFGHSTQRFGDDLVHQHGNRAIVIGLAFVVVCACTTLVEPSVSSFSIAALC